MGISSFSDSFSSPNRNLSASNVSATTGSPATGTENGYAYYIFKGSGSITFAQPGLCDVLLIGGGGGGATEAYSTLSGSGGGAGGGFQFDNLFFPAGVFTVIVGAGGAAYNPGSSSELGNYVMPGGGAGWIKNSNYSSRMGGCAGGANASTGVTSEISISTKYGQGSGAPYMVASPARSGSGGGGIGAASTNAGSGAPSAGGAGAIFTIVSSTVATAESVGEVSGSDVYYGGGGGAGSGGSGTTATSGGIGGGGDAIFNNTSQSGTANTGGGGGGSNVGVGAGGSGVVIVRVRA